MTALVKLLHLFPYQLICKTNHHKTDTMTVYSKSNYNIVDICSVIWSVSQINSAFILIWFIQNFTVVLCFPYWQINIEYICPQNINWCWMKTFHYMSKISIDHNLAQLEEYMMNERQLCIRDCSNPDQKKTRKNVGVGGSIDSLQEDHESHQFLSRNRNKMKHGNSPWNNSVPMIHHLFLPFW